MSKQRTKSKEKPIADTKTNIGSTIEKCPEMSQSMLREGGHNQNNRTEISSFPEIGDLLNFKTQKVKVSVAYLAQNAPKVGRKDHNIV